jgi:DNA-binding transcriptional ArsR family regulator
VTKWSHMDKRVSKRAQERDDRVWKALSDPIRRALLDRMRKGPATTGQLAESQSQLTRFGVMKHLGVLVDAGLVLVEREGRERWNHLNAVPIQEIYRRWIRPFDAEAADGLLRMKRRVER